MTDTPADTIAPPWTIKWRNHEPWTQEAMTVQHYAVLSMMTGRDDWDLLDVRPSDSPMSLATLIAAHLAVESAEQLPPDDADGLATAVAQSWDEVRSAPLTEVAESIMFE